MKMEYKHGYLVEWDHSNCKIILKLRNRLEAVANQLIICRNWTQSM